MSEAVHGLSCTNCGILVVNIDPKDKAYYMRFKGAHENRCANSKVSKIVR